MLKKKENIVAFRISDEEYADLIRYADGLKISIGEFLRRAISSYGTGERMFFRVTDSGLEIHLPHPNWRKAKKLRKKKEEVHE